MMCLVFRVKSQSTVACTTWENWNSMRPKSRSVVPDGEFPRVKLENLIHVACQWWLGWLRCRDSFLAINNLTGVRSINLLFRLSRPLIFLTTLRCADVHSAARKLTSEQTCISDFQQKHQRHSADTAHNRPSIDYRECQKCLLFFLGDSGRLSKFRSDDVTSMELE